MRLAVIPARGGSKRIPRKNIKPFMGQPIIGYSINTAIDSGCFDRIIVSTDDEEIADVAKAHGAEVPFLRPQALSDDMTGTIDVIAHAIDEICQSGQCPDEVCCIYATAPFVTPEDIQEGLQRVLQPDVDYCFPVGAFPAPIQRALRLDHDNAVDMFDAETRHSRSQDLEPAYHDAGQFYWGKTDAWRQQRDVFGLASRALVLPSYRVQDIDTPDDWVRAELIFGAIQRQKDGDQP